MLFGKKVSPEKSKRNYIRSRDKAENQVKNRDKTRSKGIESDP